MALDLKKNRNLGGSEFGNHVVDATAVWQAGNIAAYTTDSAGNTTVTIAGTGDNAIGVFKWDRATTLYGVVVKEAVTLTGTTASTLDHSGVSNILVEDSAGTDYTDTTDYLVVSNTITRSGTASGIASGETVYVSYTYTKTTAELEADGKNFFNNNDYVAGSNRITLLQGNWRIYTDQFDTSKNYTVGAPLYVGTGGKFSTTGSKAAGKVAEVPTASNAFLGVEVSLL